MPLPTSDQEWPPPHTKAEMKLYGVHGAWYAGDPDRLTEVYGGGNVPGIGLDPKGWDRPILGGGWWQRATRWFWGTKTPATQNRSTKIHVPIASDIAATSADLLFSEPPTLRVNGKKGQARLEKILAEAGVYGIWLEAAELAAAYGGVFLRVGWDTEMHDFPIVDVLPADAGVPEFSSGRLKAVTFWRIVHEDGKEVWRHLEKHEVGRVYHGLYRGDHDHLGRQVPLTDHPATEGFAAIVDEAGGFDSGYDKGLLVGYVPNMRPHRTLRGTSLGRSDYAGVEPIMDALDETMTSWMRDLRLGKGRIVVPEVYLQNTGRGRGAAFDPDREIYSGLAMLPPPGGSGAAELTISQFEIRVQEHRETAKSLTAQILRGAGYSVQSFGEDDGSGQAATATEIHMRRHKSYTTRGRKIGYWTPCLAWLTECLLAVDHAIYGTKVVSERATVEWPDGVMPDPEAISRTLDMLNRAQAASVETRVRMLHPEWEDPQVRAEVQKLKDEMAITVADPTELSETYVPDELDDAA
ncbi:phage portal protein [Nonomuraea basaltis]|uniref:phage portal protein n=1 Tax=Nonomuraea basaltis TaxID=2495887 RepID=UPI00110C5290|nr:phage portal protein [Nonomuraea basaltis]TMR97546.1 phage portal protein [Nonomuraea basaltis]